LQPLRAGAHSRFRPSISINPRRESAVPAALAAITVLRPGTDGRQRDFELRVVATEDDVPGVAAYIALTSVPELGDLVLALADVANAPRAD
jgi:hypothetical protein